MRDPGQHRSRDPRRGRQGLADGTDERWGPLLAERERSGQARGIARMVRGDGALIEVEMSARTFDDEAGESRSCTIFRDVTERMRTEHELSAMSAQLRALTVTDELTGLLNRRGFLAVGNQMLELADRQKVSAALLFLDLDNLKELNDRYGHSVGDAALRAVARALGEVLRRADTVSRIGGDEFVGLALGLGAPARRALEARIREHLAGSPTVTAVGARIEVSIGWATRQPGAATTLDELLAGSRPPDVRGEGEQARDGRTPDGLSARKARGPTVRDVPAASRRRRAA